MSDPGFVAAAYGIVLSALTLYAWSLRRRAGGARRRAEAIERERRRDATATGIVALRRPPSAGAPSETPP